MTPSIILSVAAFCVHLPACDANAWVAAKPNTVQQVSYVQVGKEIVLPAKSHFDGLGSDPVDIDDLIAAVEADHGPAYLADARQWVAEKFYSGKDTLSSLRLKSGMSQEQLAEKMGMKQSQLSRIERGRHDMQLSMVERLAQALDLPVNIVFDAARQSASSNIGSI